MLEIVDSADGIVKVLIYVVNLERIVAEDVTGSSELGHKRNHRDLARVLVSLLDVLEHELLINLEVIGDLVNVETCPERNVSGLIVSPKVDRAACDGGKGIEDVVSLYCAAAAVDGNELAEICKEVRAFDGGNTCAAKNVAVTRGINEHLAGVVLCAALGLGDNAAAYVALHHGIASDAIVEQISARLLNLLEKLESEDVGRVTLNVSDLGVLLGLAVLPLVGNGVEAVLCRESGPLLAQTEDDLLASAVAHRNEEVDEAESSETAEDVGFLDKESFKTVICRRNSRRNAGNTAAADDNVIFLFHFKVLCIIDTAHFYLPFFADFVLSLRLSSLGEARVGAGLATEPCSAYLLYFIMLFK